MADEPIYYQTFFDHAQCEAMTRKGEQCRMSPIWKERSTGKVFCDVHTGILFQRLKEEKEAEQGVPAVHAGD